MTSKNSKKWYKKYVRISWDRQKESVELINGHVVRKVKMFKLVLLAVLGCLALSTIAYGFDFNDYVDVQIDGDRLLLVYDTDADDRPDLAIEFQYGCLVAVYDIHVSGKLMLVWSVSINQVI